MLINSGLVDRLQEILMKKKVIRPTVELGDIVSLKRPPQGAKLIFGILLSGNSFHQS
jgi:hypothetical protein